MEIVVQESVRSQDLLDQDYWMEFLMVHLMEYLTEHLMMFTKEMAKNLRKYRNKMAETFV